MMKYLLLILFILLVILATKAMRGKPGPPQGDDSRSRPGDDDADDKLMLTCAHCGMHIPRDEALPGKGGVFCSAAHRAIVEERDVDP